MKTLVSNSGLDMTHLDVECRLEGCRVDWTFVANIYKAEKSGVPIKKETYDGYTIEALNFYKKKRFWVNYSLMKLQGQLKDKLTVDPGIIDSCIADAKSWILEATPTEWGGMLACYEHCIGRSTIGAALDDAMELYSSLL